MPLSQVVQLRPHRKVTEIEAIGGDTKKQTHLSKETLAKLSLRIEINLADHKVLWKNTMKKKFY